MKHDSGSRRLSPAVQPASSRHRSLLVRIRLQPHIGSVSNTLCYQRSQSTAPGWVLHLICLRKGAFYPTFRVSAPKLPGLFTGRVKLRGSGRVGSGRVTEHDPEPTSDIVFEDLLTRPDLTRPDPIRPDPTRERLEVS